MNSVLQLRDHGQSVWLDYIRRDLITGGGLSRLVEQDGLRGVTSNPTIFEKAIDAARITMQASRNCWRAIGRPRLRICMMRW